jgi:hypothetical protein
MSGLELDFVIYLGDPEAGAESLTSKKALQEASRLKASLKFPDVYGAVIVSRNGKEIVPRRPDPIFSLVTNFVRSVPFIIDGETETVVLAESENGFMFEPSGEDVMFSCFAGDAYEPDELLLQPTDIPLKKLGEQVLSMGERLRDLIKQIDPGVFERDDYSKSLIEFLEMGRDRFKHYQLEVERGLRLS